MNYNVSEDMKIVRELLSITQEELSDAIEVETLTIKRIENVITKTSKRTLDLFYDFVYKKKIYLNKIKEMFYKEELTNEILIFHGAKSAMAQFAKEITYDEIRAQVVPQIPWSTIITILQKYKTHKEMLWYINETYKNGWSRSQVINTIMLNN